MNYLSRVIRSANVALSTVEPLSDDVIRRVAPSIFAGEAHESRSQRYTYIPTIDLLAGLRKEGFEPFMASQANTRIEGKREHTKHMVRLRHMGSIGRALNVGDSIGEVVLVNSHDGSSSYQMFAGMFRKVCSNGLMVSESQLGSIKVPHVGKIGERVVVGAYEILDGLTRVVQAKEEMQATQVNEEEQHLLARSAIALRFDNDTGAAPVTEQQVLNARRFDDRNNDLWSTFNRIQENVIKGGLRGRNAKGKPITTREVKGIDQSVRLNRALWMLTEGMMNLKQGRPVAEDLMPA